MIHCIWHVYSLHHESQYLLIHADATTSLRHDQHNDLHSRYIDFYFHWNLNLTLHTQNFRYILHMKRRVYRPSGLRLHWGHQCGDSAPEVLQHLEATGEAGLWTAVLHGCRANYSEGNPTPTCPWFRFRNDNNLPRFIFISPSLHIIICISQFIIIVGSCGQHPMIRNRFPEPFQTFMSALHMTLVVPSFMPAFFRSWATHSQEFLIGYHWGLMLLQLCETNLAGPPSRNCLVGFSLMWSKANSSVFLGCLSGFKFTRISILFFHIGESYLLQLTTFFWMSWNCRVGLILQKSTPIWAYIVFKDVHISDSMELDDKVWPFYSLSLSL